MNFLWNDFLLVAQEWVAGADSSNHPPAIYRSIISRIYYAVFHAAFDLGETLGMVGTSSAGDHYRVRKFFEGRGRLAYQLSLSLRTLYDLRISADYVLQVDDPVSTAPQLEAQRALAVAQKSLTMIAHLQGKTK